MMENRFSIVGIGEAVFDLFPDGQRLGGAPLNVAVHAHQLAKKHGGRGVLVSRVGQDQLGQAMLKELSERGMETGYIQTDPDRPTGRVFVSFDERGRPIYEVAQGAAWDVIQFDPDLEDLAMSCSGVCFGTLAQRDAQTRNSIFRFLDVAKQAARLFDVNLRGQAYDARMLRRSGEAATIMKMNKQELPTVTAALGSSAGEGEADVDLAMQARAQWLVRTFKLEMVVVTRGAWGTRIYTKDQVVEGTQADYQAGEGADSVGAGDAATAAVLVGKALRMPVQELADLANRAGAYVASQAGAVVALPEEF